MTILPFADSTILLKDPGMIPYFLSKIGYECTFASFLAKEIVDKKEELKQFREAVNVVEISDDRKSKEGIDMKSRSILRYIWNNAKRVDVLNLYFLKHSIFYGLIYKWRNPKGILYVKLDMDSAGMKKQENQRLEPIRRCAFATYLRLIPDIVSAETNASMEYVRSRFRPQEDKLILIPDGLDDQLIETSEIKISRYTSRPNHFLVVGRIGTPQKNNELILEALPYITNWKDWIIEFVGPIEPTFETKISEFYANYPNLKKRVHFVGPMYDRKKLFSKYNESKVFIMSSKYESFGLVYAEAQYFGDYILSTRVSSIDDFLENDNDLGLVVNTPEEMGRAMQEIIDGKNRIDDTFEKRVKHGERFRWSTICKHLDEEICKIFANRNE